MMVRTIAFAVALSAAFTTVALAQTAAQRAACGADAKRYCSGVAPGGGRLVDCLAKNKSKISPACRKVLADMGR